MRHPILYILLLLFIIPGCDYSYVKEVVPVGPGDGNGDGNGDTTANQIQLSLTPTQASIVVNATQQFTALVTGTANTTVVWSLDPAVGSISATGLYTAPATINLNPTIVTVRAVLIADTTRSATAVLVISRSGGGGGDTLLPGEVCFERDVLPIFQSNCAKSGCHDVETQKKGLNFTSYASIISSVEAYEQHEGKNGFDELLEKITEDRLDKRMPPPPNRALTAGQITTLRDWIRQGAKETKCSDTGIPCDTTNITFSGTIQPVLTNNCVGCHSGSNPPKGVNLETYSGLMAVVNDGRFHKAINHLPGATPMPYKGNRLPDCTIARINAWLNTGAPNN